MPRFLWMTRACYMWPLARKEQVVRLIRIAAGRRPFEYEMTLRPQSEPCDDAPVQLRVYQRTWPEMVAIDSKHVCCRTLGIHC